jgi:hypothetical protein
LKDHQSPSPKDTGKAITVKKACEEQKVDFSVLKQKIVAEIPASEGVKNGSSLSSVSNKSLTVIIQVAVLFLSYRSLLTAVGGPSLLITNQ